VNDQFPDASSERELTRRQGLARIDMGGNFAAAP
jgi:hypothetical protein